MRQDHNRAYVDAIESFKIRENFGDIIRNWGGTDRFEEGLYGSSEMLVDGFIHLFKSGIIKRKVYDNAPLQRLINEKKITDKVTPDTLTALLESEAIHKRLTARNFEFLQQFGILRPDLTYHDGEIRNGSAVYSADLSDPAGFDKLTANCLGGTLKKGVVMHGCFFIGPKAFYDALNEMTVEERQLFNMTSVQYVNQLYGGEELKALQRKKARYINAGMKVNLLGAVTSDALEDGRVVSGVGGQYNFVSMAHALPDARSIIMIKTTRTKAGKVHSNVVFNYGHTTIPRHLRDIVVTEYGIADLRGQTDGETIARMLHVTDSRFQEGLLAQAKKARKIAGNYTIPDRFRNNTPANLEQQMIAFREQGYFQPFPLGKDLTDEEVVLIGSLRKLKHNLAAKKVALGLLGKSITSVPKITIPYLERMQLDKPASLKEKVLQKVVVYALLTGGKL
jgi:acyl-CoA hydrolase